MWRFLAMMAALAGCGDGGSGTPIDGRPRPSPYEPSVGDQALSPTLTPDDAAALVPQALSLVASYSPRTVIDLHAALLARGDAECPGAYEEPAYEGQTTLFWEADCNAPDGTRFTGAVYVSTIDRVLPDGAVEKGVSFFSDQFSIEAPDGTFLRGTSYIDVTSEQSGSHTDFYASKLGEIEASGSDPWLTGVARGSLELEATDDGGVHEFRAAGTVGVAGDPQFGAFAMRDLSVAPASCVSGNVALRGATGGWHEASFGDGCDACGDLSFEGAALGSFCSAGAVFDDLVSWETAPW